MQVTGARRSGATAFAAIRSPLPSPSDSHARPEPPYSHGTQPQDRRPAGQPRHAGGADAGGGARLSQGFLSDPRVVEIPRILWWPILHCSCSPRARKASAAALRPGLDERRLAAQGAHRAPGDAAARLPRRAREAAAARRRLRDALRQPLDPGPAAEHEGAAAATASCWCRSIPQYAASTTATAFDAAFRCLQGMRNQPARAHRQELPRPSRLHRRAGAERARLLGEEPAARTCW